MIRRPVLPLLLVLGVALAGCSTRKPPEPQGEQDPAVSGALGEQLMTDPDLARINPDNRALAGGGPAAAPIPLEDRSPEAVARARAEAARLVGAQSAAQPAALPPPAGPGATGPRDTPALAAIAALGPAGQACAAQLEYGFVWAARVPAAFPIYPRGHAQDAAGTDGKGCALRVVNFVTPVPAAEVGAFYWAMARRAGMVAEHRLVGRDHAIIAHAAKGAAVATIAAREDGLTQVDLVTSGL
jgi:hypothetical protein